MKSKKRYSSREYFSIASSIKYSTTMQKALDALADMPDDPKQHVVDDPRFFNSDVTSDSVDNTGTPPRKAMIGAE